LSITVLKNDRTTNQQRITCRNGQCQHGSFSLALSCKWYLTRVSLSFLENVWSLFWFWGCMSKTCFDFFACYKCSPVFPTFVLPAFIQPIMATGLGGSYTSVCLIHPIACDVFFPMPKIDTPHAGHSIACGFNTQGYPHAYSHGGLPKTWPVKFGRLIHPNL
jgi:hypothetical protein